MRAEVRHRDRGQSVQWHSRQGNWESNQASNQAGIMGLDNNGSKSRLSNRCINFPKDPLFITGSGVTHVGQNGADAVATKGQYSHQKWAGVVKEDLEHILFHCPLQQLFDKKWEYDGLEAAAIVHNDAGGFVRCISGSMKSSRKPFMTEILALREDVS
ncbi:hypothetical protein GOBAR_AA23320 [Gossypium barbadense]|uniref:Uncharacterized protein n=1 Tax=Gossypium barbadense TaxID=3634 RepID=A0A2P5X1X9_GOSBA|nr:hypothetical protein GOBAR_AA23320 [Gossypium barbadense]